MNIGTDLQVAYLGSFSLNHGAIERWNGLSFSVGMGWHLAWFGLAFRISISASRLPSHVKNVVTGA